MSTDQHELAPPPADSRARELWLQHAAAFILFEDVRLYALARVDPDLEPAARAAVEKGIDDAIYGLMMVADGVTGSLVGGPDRVELNILARYTRTDGVPREDVVETLSLADGDGMCMGFRGWRDGDFGEVPVVKARPIR